MKQNIPKKNLAIVLGATGNMAFALANVLIGLKKHSPSLNADYIVYEQNLSKKNKSIINSIIKCDFREYHFPKKNILNKDTLKRFSELTFSRFECFNLLKEYKKVLWLDIDILVQKDIKPLLDENSEGISLALGDQNASDFSIEIKDVPLFNAGILYLQDNLPGYETLSEWCYKKTVELAPYLKCADQGIINLMIKEHNFKVHELYFGYNFNPAFGGIYHSYATILHTYCPEKFWNYWNFKEWNENNKEWLKIGGSPYIGKKYSWWYKNFKDIPNPMRRPRKFIQYFINNKKLSQNIE